MAAPPRHGLPVIFDDIFWRYVAHIAPTNAARPFKLRDFLFEFSLKTISSGFLFWDLVFFVQLDFLQRKLYLDLFNCKIEV